MSEYTKIMRAMIRGHEVAFAKALQKGEYYEGPLKTSEQLWFDCQQVEKETLRVTLKRGLNNE